MHQRTSDKNYYSKPEKDNLVPCGKDETNLNAEQEHTTEARRTYDKEASDTDTGNINDGNNHTYGDGLDNYR